MKPNDENIVLIYGIDVTPFIKACKLFELFRTDMVTERDKAGAIQAFEFSYELAWKTMKRILSKKGIIVKTPRDCFREAFRIGMISDARQWFNFIDKRNSTSHVYDERCVVDILEIFDDFSVCLNELLDYIDNERTSIS